MRATATPQASRGEWGQVEDRAAIESIRHARELGVNVFDTAQGYGFGTAERLLGRALAGEMDQVVIATKGGLRMDGDTLVRDSSPTWIRRGVEESLSALGVDHIDLYQVHWPDPRTPLAETAAAIGTGPNGAWCLLAFPHVRWILRGIAG
ncbi:aldo/keto reductase [Actinomadura madurae]|uniref:aldo/keto reductase n=1 Tax=Actinomadura madurae TaxID=1993 RepID=UPI0020271294|nr:aldo/keto reductase [Actinomadura madurae]URM96463.1 aldo/keto reductase [Actinomadura madurae]